MVGVVASATRMITTSRIRSMAPSTCSASSSAVTEATTALSCEVWRGARPSAAHVNTRFKCQHLSHEFTYRDCLRPSQDKIDHEIIVLIKSNQNVLNHVFIIKRVTYYHHVIAKTLHLGQVFCHRQISLVGGGEGHARANCTSSCLRGELFP
jgi:hypothetical protein